MAIDWAGQGTYAYGSTVDIPTPYPPGIQADDLLILVVMMKPSPGLRAAPRSIPYLGWTSLADRWGGYGNSGNDIGPVGASVYWKYAVGNESGTSWTMPGQNGMNTIWNSITRFTKSPGFTWVTPIEVGYVQTTALGSTSLSYVLPSINLQAGDFLFDIYGVPTDLNGSTRFVYNTAVTASGFTFFDESGFQNPYSAIGYDIGGSLTYSRVLTGAAANVVPTWKATVGSAAGGAGPLTMVRLREVGGGEVGVWNGTAWKTDPKVWNGTAWKSDFKVWNGTAWKTAGSGVPPVGPVANLSTPTGGITSPQNVTWTNSSTGTITSYLWNFDNGFSGRVTPQTATGPGPHTVNYNATPVMGFVFASLTVTGPGGSNTKFYRVNLVP